MSFFEFSASDLESLAKLLTPPAEAEVLLLMPSCAAADAQLGPCRQAACTNLAGAT